MERCCILLIIMLLSINEMSAQNDMLPVCYTILEKGKKEYDAGNYDEAIKKFKEGERISACKDKCNEWINKCEERIREQVREQQREKRIEISTVPDAIDRQMIYVQGGEFDMGCPQNCSKYESPVHQVVLNDFYIGKYEITQEIWKDIMGDNRSDFVGNNLPVESVTWNEVQDFIYQLNKLSGRNYRLPTEAEWEYAAQGGNQSNKNIYSGSSNAGSTAWYYLNSNGSTHFIGGKRANELGIYDMSGNVSEWCSDLFGIYRSGIQTNPMGNPTGSKHVVRGGHWDSDATELQVSSRNSAEADYSDNTIGFRLAHDGEKKRAINKVQKPEEQSIRNQRLEQDQQDKQTDNIQKYRELMIGINLGASFLNQKDDYEVSKGAQLDIMIGGLFSRYFGVQAALSATAYSTGDTFNDAFGLGGLYIGPLLNLPLNRFVSANFEIYPAIGIAQNLNADVNNYIISERIGCGFRFKSGHAFYRLGANYTFGELRDKDLSSFGVSLGIGLSF